MTILELKSKKRDVLGKKVKALRKQGQIPAVVYPVRNSVSNGIYGDENSALPITLDAKEFNNIFKSAGETTLIKLSVDGGIKNVLVHDISRDPITGKVNHVDFYEVKMDEKIIAKVPLIFSGDSLAINDLSGVLVKAMQELEVRALPANLPHEITVDISRLKTFDDNICVKDIKIPKEVEVLENLETSVAAVVPPRSETELEALAGKVEEKVEEVKVETEEKAKERQEEKKEEKTVV